MNSYSNSNSNNIKGCLFVICYFCLPSLCEVGVMGVVRGGFCGSGSVTLVSLFGLLVQFVGHLHLRWLYWLERS